MLEDVRPADEADIPELVELARAAIAELEPLRGGMIWKAREARREPLADGFASALAGSDTRVLAGTFDGVVVGYAVAHTEVLAEGARLGVVSDIFVDLEARGVGVGEAMMSDLVAWCEKQGCVGVDAMALPGARETKNFFEDQGFTARQLVMHHRLENGLYG